MIEVKLIDFKTILPIWENYLWPNRKTEIKPLSSMQYLGGYDMSIYDYTPKFFAVFVNNKIVGVNSGFKTSNLYYRSRGIYVFDEYRKLGISQKLFEITEHSAKEEGCSILWSVPRKSAINSYLKFGFNIVSEWTNEMEFGPNCYVCKDIS